MSSVNPAEVEQMAKTLAAQAGVVWECLSDYPGFERGRWRSEAKRFLSQQQPSLH